MHVFRKYRFLHLNLVTIIILHLLISVDTAPVARPYAHNSKRHSKEVAAQNVRKPFIEVRNSTYHGAGPREEARAMCSVRTHEVNATANATITRRLHGVVTSRELHQSMHRLELIIFGQMQQLWQSVDALRAHLTGLPAEFPDRKTVAFSYHPAPG